MAGFALALRRVQRLCGAFFSRRLDFRFPPTSSDFLRVSSEFLWLTGFEKRRREHSVSGSGRAPVPPNLWKMPNFHNFGSRCGRSNLGG
jgi:hypothetical protein